jgi:uncharacterized protein YndB with AHSA1/START domain
MNATTNPAAARRNGDKPFIITRTLDAPRARVWKAWTDRDELQRWFGPKGFTMSTATLDLRPGGTFHYCLRTPDGQDMWGRWTFREVVAPERLVLISSFSDAKGGITLHPMSPTWPRETLSTTTFTERGGKTDLEIRWSVWNGTEEEHRTFDGAHAGMTQGWSGTFEQLAAYLTRA